MNNDNITISNDNLVLHLASEYNSLRQKYFGIDLLDKNNDELDKNNDEMHGSPNFKVAIAGVKYGMHSNTTHAYYDLADQMIIRKVEKDNKTIVMEYYHPIHKFSIVVKTEGITDIKLFRQTVTMKNESLVPIVITHLSSLFTNGIATEGNLKWDRKNKIKIHYCTQAWEGEGQWKCAGLEDLGIYHTSINSPTTAFHLSSIGSWSTGRFVPVILIEDTETRRIWYSQLETSSSWHISTGYMANYNSSSGSMYIQMDAADEKYGDFRKQLSPGESFTTQPAVFGCCEGAFADAVKELTKYKRNYLLPSFAHDGEFPLIFNDYMNCLWADPDNDKLIPLINNAAKLGAECFCIDAGWFGDKGLNWGKGLGDWKLDSNRFGEFGLSGILQYIKKLGMIPGIWMEMEVCGENSELNKRSDDWFLLRDGVKIGGGDRLFLNFANPEVREFLHQKIKSLVDIGVGFIKNDYNDCIGIGTNNTAYSYGEGLLQHTKEFSSFIDEVRALYPALILENCASGAMRQDYSILSHFHIQSISDQEHYNKMPSIIIGSLANLLPEQSGIWSYPIPVLSCFKDDEKYIASKEFADIFADGEQTAFNMVSGMCGNLYLSGRIDLADDLNFSLIKEGVDLYKNLREHIRTSFPIWPSGMLKFNNDDSWGSIALANNGKTHMTIAVWKLDSKQNKMEFDFSFLKNKKVTVKQIYPLNARYKTEYSFNCDTGLFNVTMDGKNKARLFVLYVN